jgi:bla regulator protein BlaR1
MITYLLKVIMCSGCLLLFYRLVLEREKMFHFNRFYLLGSLVVSVVLPLIPMEIFIGQALFSPPPDVSLGDQAIPGRFSVPLVPEPTLPTGFPWFWLLGIGYLMIGGTLLFRFGKNILGLMNRIRTCELIQVGDTRLVLVDSPTLPHSFLQYVFLPKATYLQGTLEREILDHERAHVRQWHSLDILFVEILKVIFWFNPAFYFYRHAIALNHEFLADEAVIRTYRDIPTYQHLLLQKATYSSHQLFTSQFNYSFTKKRFLMMNKQTSRSRALLTQSAVLPLLAVIFFAFSDLTLAQIAPPPPPVERASPSPSVERNASSDVVKEYNALVAKYNNKSHNGPVSLSYPSHEDGERMIVLRETMSKEQADTLRFKIYRSMPLPKSFLSKGDFEKYKNPNVYGIWVDGKKIANNALENYTPEDLIQGFISRVYPNAQPKTGYKYKYQVDLMTEKYYDSYRKEYLANPRFRLVRRDQPKQ